MQFVQNFKRPDTMFGVCQSLGEDLGVSPNWFRVALAAVVIYNLEIAIVTYAVLGAIVLASRFLFPGRAAQPAETVAMPAETPVAQAAPVLAEAA